MSESAPRNVPPSPVRGRSLRATVGVALLITLVAACGGAEQHAIDGTTTSVPPVQADATTTTATDPTGFEAEILSALDEARTQYGATGAVAVIRVPGNEWRVASGSADATGSPLTADATFRIGSITKPVVAALALHEVADGRLGLDEDVTEIVGSPLRSEPPVTLRMLLDHSSGIFDIGNEGDPVDDIARLSDPALLEEAQGLVSDLEAGLPAVASDRLVVGLAETHDRYFPPGSGYHYSNTNYQLVGIILETITGRSIQDLLASGVVAPLELSHTSIAPIDRTTPDLHGYAIDVTTGEVIDATDDLMAFGNGASGGILSTGSELATIMTAIVHGTLVDEALHGELLATTSTSGHTYGLGIATYQLSCGTFHGHEGRVNGTATIALVDAETPQRSIVVAVNRSDIAELVGLADRLVCSATALSS